MISFAAMVVAVACSTYSEDLLHPQGRRNGRQGVLPSSGEWLEDSLSAYDTSLYVSGVRVLDGYDWRRDTLAGHFRAELVVYRDTVPALILPAGDDFEISPEPDTHHLLGGRLFTEYSTLSHTVIRCNGEECLRFEGREFLLGIVEKEGHLHTLSGRRGGDGFVYRVDGAAVLSKSGGKVFGSFREYSCPGTGALYEDDGRVCFCFSCSSSVMTMVRDGEETDVPAPVGTLEIHDARIVGGKLCSVCRRQDDAVLVHGEDVLPLGADWRSALSVRVYASGGSVVLAGSAPGGGALIIRQEDGSTFLLRRPNCLFLRSAGSYMALSIRGSTGMELLVDGKAAGYIPGRYLFLSPQTVGYSGGVASLLLNPADEPGPCMLWRAGEERVYDGVDYLTGMETVVSRSSSGRVPRPG